MTQYQRARTENGTFFFIVVTKLAHGSRFFSRLPARCIIITVLILAGCSQAPLIPSPAPPYGTATATAIPRPLQTSDPLLASTSTSMPNLLPSQPISTSIRWPTPSTMPRPTLISPDNASEIKQFAQFGMGTLNAIDWSWDGVTIAVASSTGIHLYDADTFQIVRTIPTEQPVGKIAFNRDGRRLMSVEWWNHGLRIWNTANGNLVQGFDISTGPWICAAFSPDGQTVALAKQIACHSQSCPAGAVVGPWHRPSFTHL
jgi:hypothetical protein